MKQEEEAVDIDNMDDVTQLNPESNGHVMLPAGSNEMPETDEDALWADEESDDDVRGWKMKVIIGHEDDDV
jgi:COMPASS component SWD1